MRWRRRRRSGSTPARVFKTLVVLVGDVRLTVCIVPSGSTWLDGGALGKRAQMAP